MQKRGHIKGVLVLKPPNIALVREAEEKGFIQELPIRQQEVIRRRYPQDGKPKTLSQIADDMNITRQGVSQKEGQALRRIRRLLEGKNQTDQGRPREDIDINEVVRLYTKEKKTKKEIARLMHCSKDVISDRLKVAGELTRSEGRRKIEVDINLIARQYFAEEMIPEEIGKPLGISRSTVLNRLREAGYKVHPVGRPRKK